MLRIIPRPAIISAKLLRTTICLVGAFVLGGCAMSPGGGMAAGAFTHTTVASGEEFIGPFPSWAHAVRDFGARGDGIADDSDALQAALNDLGLPGKPSTLYLPAGVYRVTKPLRLFRATYVRVVGEDPQRVTLRWDGPSGETMLRVDNSWRIGIGRIRFDGAQRAHAGVWLHWDRRLNDFFPTHFEFADCIFQDMGVGIQGGEDPKVAGYQDTAAEVIIKRTRFLRAADAGILVRDWNTVDWWVTDCLFEDNLAGVRNVIGGVHVYHSIFRHSREADVFASDVEYMSLRDNYSSGSRRFLATSGPAESGIALTLQRNTIVNAIEAPVSVRWAGALLLLDNRIDFAGPAVVLGARVPGNLVSIGNRFTRLPFYRVDGAEVRARSIDDALVTALQAQEPAVPAFASTFSAPTLEVSTLTGAAIQTAIDTANRQYPGRRAVVHLPRGAYDVRETLVVPAGGDLRLVGDGFEQGSNLELHPGQRGPTLRIDAPSAAQLIDIDVHGGSTQTAIEVAGADTAGASLYLEQAEINPWSVTRTGLDIDGTDFLSVESRFALVGSVGTGVRVAGGTRTGNGEDLGARVQILGGTYASTGSSGPNWLVQNGARLTVQDHWYENNTARPITLQVVGGGDVTFHGGKQHSFTGANPSSLNLLLDGIKGHVSLVGIRAYGQHLATAGSNPDQNFLFLGGCLCPQDSNPTTVTDGASAGRTAVLYNSVLASPLAASALAPNAGPNDDAFLLAMLAQARATKWRDFGVAPSGTDIRLYRVGVDSAATGIWVH